jgi:SAM-dependent methyltransferase
VTSDVLLSIVRCPDCGGVPRVAGASRDDGAAATARPSLICGGCGRVYPASFGSYLDLRPSEAFSETTKYMDEALHADSRHETVSPPLLSAAIRNDMLRSMLKLTPSDRVIDLGCGSGRALVWNEDLGAYRVGVDVTPHFAREALAGVDLLIGDLRKLPLASGSFSKAFSLDVAEHLSRESLVAVLTEARRVLQPGGALFLYTHVRKNSWLAGGLRIVNRIAYGLDRVGLISLGQERLRKSDHINPLADMDDFRDVVTAAGFRVERLRYYTPLVGAVIENLLMRMAEQALARRASRRMAKAGGSGDAAADAAGIRAARLSAKQRVEQRGFTYAVVRLLTWIMKLDIVLFSRVETGPFFALLVNEPPR